MILTKLGSSVDAFGRRFLRFRVNISSQSRNIQFYMPSDIAENEVSPISVASKSRISRPEVFCKRGVLKKFRKIPRKTPVLESSF